MAWYLKRYTDNQQATSVGVITSVLKLFVYKLTTLCHNNNINFRKDNKMNNSNIRKKPYWLFYYSLPAFLGILAIYLCVSIFDKNLFCGGDGWLMQYTATEYAREFWRNVFSGSWTAIDFTIGEGLDPWVTLTYYGLTDPMNLILAPFSQNLLPTVFSIITMFKLYLSGVAFGWYASTRSVDHKAIAIGALVYTFSGFFLFWLFCPGIMSTGYLFPILLYAIDKAFDKNKYTLFAVLTLFAYVTNYYAGMTLSFMLIVYAIIRIIYNKNLNKSSVCKYGKIVLAHALGIISSLFVLLPVLIALSGGSRSASSGYSDSLLWFNWEYYVDLLISMFTPFNNAMNYWNFPYKSLTHFICIAAPSLVLFLTTKTEKQTPARLLKWCLLVASCFICIPFFSKLMNMWMYPTHRWVFAFSMIVALIVVWAVPRFYEISWKVKIISIVALVGGSAASFINMYSRAAIITIITVIVALLIMFIKPRRLTAYVATCISLVMFILATFIGNTFGTQFCFSDIVTRKYSEAYAAVRLTDEELEDFIRVGISDNMTATNTGMLLGYNTTTAVWNVTSGEICTFNSDVNSFPNAEVDWWVDGWDDRTALHTLAGTKYYIIEKEKDLFIPYGFDFYKEVEIKDSPLNPDPETQIYHVYTNNYNPGIGYLFTETLSSKTFNELDIASKQAALMKYAITDNSTNMNPVVTTFEIPIQIQKSTGCVTVTADIPKGYEVYLYVDDFLQTENNNQVQIKGYQYWSNKETAARFDTSQDAASNYAIITVTNHEGECAYKTIRATCPNAHLSRSNPVRTVCLGHKLSGQTTITIKCLSDSLKLGNIKLYGMQTSEYVTSALNLKNSAWTDIKYSKRGSGNNIISGKLNAQTNGVFQLAVPYSRGWKAYVDGNRVETFTSGVKYIGINVEQGEHDIQFKYETPGLRIGIILSSISLTILLVWTCIENKNNIKRMLSKSKYSTLCRYLITGCCTTTLDFVVYILLTKIGLFIPVAKFTSSALMFVLSFLLNKYWSFNAGKGNTAKQSWKFIIAQTLNICTNTAVNSLVLSICDIKIIAFAFATLAGMIIGFVLQCFWVFKKEKSV